MHRRNLSVLGLTLALAAASPALARTKLGITMADAIEVGGAKLALNGQGVREATIFKVEVYVAGLYLEEASHDAAAIVASNGPKRLVMQFLRDVSRDDLVGAYRDGFAKNGGDGIAAEVEAFLALVTDVKKGDQVVLTFLPDRGVTLAIRGREVGAVAGQRFARSLLSIWLGRDPPNEGLKTGLLGEG